MTSASPTHRHTHALLAQGYRVVAGVDEVGRGCLAGPVVAAAVVLPSKSQFPGLNDSKKLSALQRRKLETQIKRNAVAIGIGWVGSELIDSRGLTWAVGWAAKLALADMNLPYDAVLLDGAYNYLGDDVFVQTVTKGDSLCLNIAAASVIAKVTRDNYMHLQHNLYPNYGFDRHVGYGTLQHMQALQGGLSPLHRRLFRPIRQLSSYGLPRTEANPLVQGLPSGSFGASSAQRLLKQETMHVN